MGYPTDQDLETARIESRSRNRAELMRERLTPIDVEHMQMVGDLAKPGDEIAAKMSGVEAHLLHMAVGVAGEAGELLDAIKKHVVYKKPLDENNVIEELGDLEFYLQGIRSTLGVFREQVLEANMKKLLKGKNARYKEGKYSDEQASARADKG